MSTSIIPKSEIRANNNIQVGFGEVPAVEVNGVQGWAMPGGHVTFKESEAIAYATELDEFLKNTKNFSPQDLMRSRSA